MTTRRSLRCGRSGSTPEKRVLPVVGTDGLAKSGLCDGSVEPVDAGQDGERFRGVLGEVQNLVAGAAHQGRGNLEQPRGAAWAPTSSRRGW